MKIACVAVALCACSQEPSKLDDIFAKPVKATAPKTFDAAAIDAWVGAQIAERGAVGAALVIVRDGKTVLAKGYGKKKADAPDAVDADTPFALGSVSKQFACVAAYQLADAGKLAMTDAVAKYFPKLTRAADITLADLGGHTAGYRDYYPLDYVDERMTVPVTPDALIERYAMRPLDFEPRARYSYSNTGFVVLARVIEMAAGAPYADVLAKQIFQPLGMTTASLVRPASGATGHVAFLTAPAKPAPLEAPQWLFGAGDIWASANDLAKWDLAIAQGKLVTPESHVALRTARALADGRTTNYSCGFGIATINRETVLGHGGWVGGFWTHNAIVPRTQSAVVLLTNDEKTDLGDLHDTIVRLVTRDDSGIPEILGVPPETAARDLIVQLQRGVLDRTKLGEDLSAYYDDARVAAHAVSLRSLGTPTVTVDRRGERGGMEVTGLTIAFATKTFTASMFRSPDGRVHQLLFFPRH
jgi:CubicO group peptidase (beta-lactamase class C family)